MNRDHAVVIGASMSGLCVASVLAEHFAEVTVLERDSLTGGTEHRRGVPQGSQLHILQPRGARDLEALFPGLLSELEGAGVPVLPDFDRVHADFGGHVQCRQASIGFPFFLASRPFLEATVRARALPRVQLRASTETTALIAEGSRIAGVVVRDANGSARLQADLVVDCSGRGGRCAVWLNELGFGTPAQERIDVDIAYAAAILQMPEVRPGADECLAVAATPARPWGLGSLHQENDRWILTAYGYHAHHPPLDRSGLLDLAKQLVPHHWFLALEDAQWPDRAIGTRFPSSVRRRYDRMRRFPDGLLVLGDALCSFNPIYGQGMTIGAIEALALRDCLTRGHDGLARRVYAAVDKPLGTAWQLGATADRRFPGVAGGRPLHVRALERYVDLLQAAACHDPRVTAAFWRVSSLLDPPGALFSPRVVAAVARHGLTTSPRRNHR